MHSLDPPQRTKIRSFPGAERRFTNRFVHPSGFATTKGLNPGPLLPGRPSAPCCEPSTVPRRSLARGTSILQKGLVLSRHTGDIQSVLGHYFADAALPCNVFRAGSPVDFCQEQCAG